MDKEANNGHAPPPAVEDGPGATEKPGSPEGVATDKSSAEGKVHEFNEQTNYVPKRTIITVRPLRRGRIEWHELTVADIPGLRRRRPFGPDGPDDVGDQLVHHWQCIGVDRPSLLDRKRLLHV